MIECRSFNWIWAVLLLQKYDYYKGAPMKAFFALTLASLFIAQAHAVENMEFKIVSKECKGESQPVAANEKIKFINGMLAKFSPAVSDDSKSCNQVEVSFLASSSFATINKVQEEEGMLLQPQRRVVCRDPKTSEVLSDVTSDLENPGVSFKVSINKKKQSGSVVLTNSSECPEGELKLQLNQ
jgi:hypothetical protein